MNGIKKLNTEDDSSSFTRLPDEMVLQILNKLIDLKTLCHCKLVSKRFCFIVSQVDAISFTFATDPLVDAPDMWSAIESLMTFQRVKSLSIQLPCSYDNHLLFKWKFNFEAKHHSVLFLSPDSVYLNKESYANENFQEHEEEEDMELTTQKHEIARKCLKDVVMRVGLLIHVTELPLLENVSITDLGKRGKVSLGRGKVAEMNKWLTSLDYENSEEKAYYLDNYGIESECYVPFLELPVSGYVMKGVYFYLMDWTYLPDDNYNRFIKAVDDDDFEDKDEAAYSEAMMEIFRKHSGKIERLELEE